MDFQVNLEGSEGALKEAFGLGKKGMRTRDIYLYDSADLRLFRSNIQIRLRIEDDRTEIGVKRWGLSAEDFQRFEQRLNGDCEIDLHGEIHIRSCRVKKIISENKALKLINGNMHLFDVLNTDQLSLLLDGHLPEGKPFDDVQPLGPIRSRAWEWSKGDHRYSLDIQILPNSTEVFAEISLKTDEQSLPDKARQLLDDLMNKSVTIRTDQHGRRIEKLRGLLLSCEELLNSSASE